VVVRATCRARTILEHEVGVTGERHAHGLCCCAHGFSTEGHCDLGNEVEVHSPRYRTPRNRASCSASRGVHMLHMAGSTLLACNPSFSRIPWLCCREWQYIRVCWRAAVGVCISRSIWAHSRHTEMTRGVKRARVRVAECVSAARSPMCCAVRSRGIVRGICLALIGSTDRASCGTAHMLDFSCRV
jgi:hypothetical protein